jgi:hypothetical protein
MTSEPRAVSEPASAVAVLGTGIRGKDVDLAIAAAEGTPLPMLEALSRQRHAAVEAGYGRDDVSAARLHLAIRHGRRAER